MPQSELYYLTEDIGDHIGELINQFSTGAVELTAEELLERINELLPIEKMNHQTVLRRVEGYSQATDLLWEKILEIGKLDKQEIITRANLKPMSYYHYLTGSREAPDYAKSREDMLNDPSTALVKLRDDIIGLADLMLNLK